MNMVINKNTIDLSLDISPIPQPRMTQRGKYVKENAINYLKWKEEVGWEVKLRFKNQSPWTELLKMSGKFYLTLRMYNQCDLSNLIKAIEDALQGIIYLNDKQIKSYGTWQMIPISNNNNNNERIELLIEKLDKRSENENKK